jgi:hypothetical protein
MNTGTNTLIMASYDDLQKLINKDYADLAVKASYARFDNVLVGIKDISNFHHVSDRTVLSYIKDGLIVPEVKLNENEHPKFRLSYALNLDFKELQKQLRAKNKGWIKNI